METNRISALQNVVNAGPRLVGPAPSAASDESPATAPVDFAFLAAQTFADGDLEREVLTLFVAQARRVVPSLPALAPQAQSDAAHLLKGSARGIGAWPAADVAEAYELAGPGARASLQAALEATLAQVETAIAARLGKADALQG